jgi:lipid-binding SYLF domain-containing protein
MDALGWVRAGRIREKQSRQCLRAVVRERKMRLPTRKDQSMKKKLAMIALCLAVPSLLFAQKKEDERLAKSATAIQEILEGDNGLPKNILNQAVCVLIYPSVKKIAIGIGGSYGRGALVCRKGAKMNGAWGAPAMYSLDQSSVGLQLGSTATDFVLVVMNQKGADQILSGKTKLGGNAAAAAGPTGAQATSYSAEAMNVDVLTYSRSKGLFAGVSLEGATMDTDNDANRALYGKDLSTEDIVKGSQPVVPAAKPLVNLLDKMSPTRRSA